MANRDKAPSRAPGADRERPGMVGAVAGEHPGTQRVFGRAGIYRAAGAGASPHVPARSDHPRRPDARHARVRGLSHPAERSAVQRHHPDRHHHLGALGPDPAARGVSRRRLGVPRPAARRRGAPPQARHLPPVQAGGRWPPRGESARSRHRAVQHAGPVPPRPRDRGRGVPPPRSARVRRLRARRWRTRTKPSQADEEVAPHVRPGRHALPPGRPRVGRDRPPGPDGVRGHRPGHRSGAASGMVRRLGGAIEASPDSGPRRRAALRIRAGYCAVPDFAESSVDAVELLLRATTALRDLRREGGRANGSGRSSRCPSRFAN